MNARIPARSSLAVLLVCVGPSTGLALAQTLPPPPPDSRVRSLPLDSCLQDAARLARARSLAEVRSVVGPDFVRISDEGRVHVEVVVPEGFAAVSADFVARFGGVSDTRWRNRLDAWIPLERVVDLAVALPDGHRVVRASAGETDDVPGEGPAAIGSDGYRNGGANGTGLTIAVIDGGYVNLTAARANGDAPSLANTTFRNYTPSAFEADGTHGTGCVEAAFDHCPGATWRLYKIDSLADMGTAVSDAVSNGVDVITHSLSRYNQGWADDSGAACAAAAQAGNARIPFFTSAGNRADQHWQGVFSDASPGNGWHDFAAGDESINMVFAPGDGASFYLSWNRDLGVADYDLYLFDSTYTTVLASSTAGSNTFESFYWQNTGPTSVVVQLGVYRFSGATLEFELFAHGGGTWVEHVVSAGSTTSPSNSANPNVLSVGAVDWADFSQPKGTLGILMGYSSQGPSNSGMTLPDLVGPTNTHGFTYSGTFGFGGTSGATPNVAGAACALWSSVNPFDGYAIRWLIKELARLHRDWGTGGSDNLYGDGGASLVDYEADTVWLARGSRNTLNLTWGPYYTLDAAVAAAGAGKRIVVLPGSYLEHPAPVTKPLRILAYEGSSVMGF